MIPKLMHKNDLRFSMLLYGACLLKEPTKARVWSRCWGHLLEPAPQAQGSPPPAPTGTCGLSRGHSSNSGKDFSWLNNTCFIAPHVGSPVVKSNLCRQVSAAALLSQGTRAKALEPQTIPCQQTRFQVLQPELRHSFPKDPHTPCPCNTWDGRTLHSPGSP